MRSAGSSQQFDLTYEHGPFGAFVAGQWLKNATATTTDRTIMAGASYEIGKATVYGGFSAVKWADLGIDSRVYGLSVKYRFNPANYVALGYAYLHDQSSQGNHADRSG